MKKKITCQAVLLIFISSLGFAQAQTQPDTSHAFLDDFPSDIRHPDSLEIRSNNKVVEHVSRSNQVYTVEVATKGNKIELTVVNGSKINLEEVVIEVKSLPTWLLFNESSQTVGTLFPGVSKQAMFIFKVIDEAPVDKTAPLIFEAKTENGISWSRKLTIKVTGPEKFELSQNYPNPFNPTTNIRYQLPNKSEVKIEIYNILGNKIATLVNEVKEPGVHTVNWDASFLASGLYLYQILIKNESGQKFLQQKKMMLIK
ncbi:MAG: T9SS type A sorting domain-containing protein [Gracilimonas sp.]|nr:T9SS type A sorting domain-containing protein [Gracilimonas sp.]